ncbi:MAG: hypothetical protein ACO3J2_02660 [Chthoniobacterales bacterium]|jgi:hypothetical protein
MRVLRVGLLLALSVCLARAEEAATFAAGDFTFPVPSGWRSVQPSSPMRKAELRVPGPEGTGEAGEATITVFHFGPGQGGTVQQNVDRWFGQFDGDHETKGAASARETVGTVPVTFARARGTFQSGMPGQPATPLEGQALLGAILESPKGDVYVKMTGPAPTVEMAEPAFVQMVRAACGG